jgi:hypothetical protein
MGRKALGYATVGKLLVTASLSASFVLSSAAWALDLDQAISQQNSAASQIVKTLGRDKKPNSQTRRHTKKKVYVVLIKRAHSHKKA